jgi:chaperonin GroES
MKIRPLQDRILVQPIKEKEVRKSGIIIPDSAQEKPIEGRVKAVGAGKVGEDGKRVKLDVKVGDKVLYSKYGGTEIKIEGEDFLLMREDDVLGIVE